MATTPAPAATAPSKRLAVTTTFAGGSQVLMAIEGYSNLVEALVDAGGSIKSESFRAGGRSWYIRYRQEINEDDNPSSDEDEDDDSVTVYLCLDHDSEDKVMANYKLTIILDRSGERIYCTGGKNIFSITSDHIGMMEMFAPWPCHEGSFHVRCDVTVVEVTKAKPLHLHGDLVGLLASKVGSDVTFEVAGEVFTAHRCVLATRSNVFKAEFFGPGKENAAATPVRIVDMEPKVFKELLHFIYTDTLPKFNKGDEVAMAIGLLLAADRYDIWRLGSVCEDIFFVYADARTAVATLELADKNACDRLRKACIRSLKDLLAKEEAKI